RSEMHQNLENARVLLRSTHVADDGEAYAPSDNAERPEVAHRYRGNAESPQFVPEPRPPFAGDDAAVAAKEWDEVAASKLSSDAPIRVEKRVWLKRAGLVIFFGIVLVFFPIFRSKWRRMGVGPPLRASGDSLPVVDRPQPAPEPTLTSAEVTADRSFNESPSVEASVPPVPRP